ncbi:MAG: gamma-glutamyltransferase [Thermorudis peleae]|nr:gamma-glutamyltransferase [Thermorudis peleae]
MGSWSPTQRTGRPTTLAHTSMIATPHYLATLAGLHVLRDGGNAIDAAIAANAVLTVVYPHQCSLGGDLFCLLWEPYEQRLYALNGSGPAPRGATIDAVQAAGYATMPQRGPWSVTVPGVVGAWEALRSRFGTQTFERLLAPALHFAEHGFPVSPLLHAAIAAHQTLLAQHPPAAAQFLPGGRVPAIGDRLVQPAVAQTLRRISADGAQAFYTGAIAEAIAHTVQQAGGVLTADDLAQYQPEWVEPLRTTYRGVELVELPPNTHGVTAMQLLHILEGYDVATLGWGTPALLHRMLEAKKLAFADRDRYLGDPAYADIPLTRLLDKAYAATLRAQIDQQHAQPMAQRVEPNGDTVYLCVVDREGRAVSLIQSIFSSFGSGLVAEGAGIVLHNRGAAFQLDPASPNALAPGKRPLHTLIPAMLLRDGQPWVVFGTMGAHAQPQIHLQLVTNIVDFGFEPQTALEAPRWVSHPEPEGEVVRLEEGFPSSVADALATLGHRVQWEPRWSSAMGHAHLIMIDRSRGLLLGASDPRAEGYALGE